MHMAYPGNDPENGPARWTCPQKKCYGLGFDREEREFYYGLSMENAHDQAIHELKEDKYWDDMEAKYPS